MYCFYYAVLYEEKKMFLFCYAVCRYAELDEENEELWIRFHVLDDWSQKKAQRVESQYFMPPIQFLEKH